jgi:AIPR protein.
VAISIEDYYKEFFQDVLGSADADGRFVEDTFFEKVCAQLVDAGELDTADRAQYMPARGGMRIDGYGGDPLSTGGVLSLIVADFHQSQEVGTLTATEMDGLFKRATNFLSKSLDPEFRNSLEETHPSFGLADLIAKRWSAISKVRLMLISNRILSARVDGREAGEFRGTPITYSVWDFGRLYRYVTSGHGREEVEIDLSADFGGSIPALPAHLTDAGYEAYLMVVPGRQLASIYDRWGARLLEQNVRVFLQARGSVNKGIRKTIEDDPEMFFAYNNGVTATAEEVETELVQGSLRIKRLKNLQIVNGGQTTASIHAASRRKDIDLSKVFVQMKLSIIPPERTSDVVPKISEFANSQNRVNAADFFSNHPFHVRMEDFSRRIFAPSPDGTFRESKWFYERARGQYHDAKARHPQPKKFELEYPKNQVFSKTDLAKFLNVWRGHPDIVSKGAQKNFAEFAKAIGREWTNQPDAFNETFYKHAVAKAIVFREVEKIVTEQPWYQGGYRANVVAYAIAKLAHDVEARKCSVDFDLIWRNQGMSESMKNAFVVVSKVVHDSITATPESISNVTEWAKHQACWKRVSAIEVDWPKEFLNELITAEEQRETRKAAVKDQKVLNGIEAQTAVVQAGSVFWEQLRAWGMARHLLSPTESGILSVAASVPSRIPSDKQCLIAMEVWQRLRREGCRLEPSRDTNT